MKLYEITNGLQAVLDGGYMVDEETGEILFDSSTLDRLEIEYNDKLESCGLYIKNLEAEVTAIENEIENLTARKNRLANKAKNMREYILHSMEQTETSKLETAKVALSTRTNSHVEVVNLDELPKEYIKEKVTYQPNKAQIKKALVHGDEVKGAMLIKSKSLSIR